MLKLHVVEPPHLPSMKKRAVEETVELQQAERRKKRVERFGTGVAVSI